MKKLIIVAIILVVGITAAVSIKVFTVRESTKEPTPYTTIGPETRNKMEEGANVPAEKAITGEDSTATVTENKIIKNGRIYLNVDDIEKAINNIQQVALKYNGYVSSELVQLYDNKKQGNIEIMVENKYFVDAMNEITLLGNVKSKSTSTKDITSEYIDLQSRLSALKKERDRIMGFMDKAKDVKDLVTVENYLKNIQTEIEQLQGRINYLDKKTDFSSINIELLQTNMASPAPKGFYQNFIQSLKNLGNGISHFFVWTGKALPYIIFYGIIIVVILFVLKRFIKKVNA